MPTYADVFWLGGRLKHMNNYFSAFRVDHILGFFRLWELPPHAITGLSGHFNPSSPVSASDLDKLGLWDRQRLSTPYVRAHLLQRRFGRYLRCCLLHHCNATRICSCPR